MTFDQLMGFGAEFPNKSVKQLYENNQSVYKEIKALVSQNILLPVIGAGFSASIYPTWSRFLIDTAESYPDCIAELHRHLNKGEYEEAADVVCEEMTDFAFRQKISTVFSGLAPTSTFSFRYSSFVEEQKADIIILPSGTHERKIKRIELAAKIMYNDINNQNLNPKLFSYNETKKDKIDA